MHSFAFQLFAYIFDLEFSLVVGIMCLLLKYWHIRQNYF